MAIQYTTFRNTSITLVLFKAGFQFPLDYEQKLALLSPGLCQLALTRCRFPPVVDEAHGGLTWKCIYSSMNISNREQKQRANREQIDSLQTIDYWNVEQ